MIDPKAIEALLHSLWMRVRTLEMIVVRDADNESTRHMLHGIRQSLYETCEYYADAPIDNFTDVCRDAAEEPKS